MSKQDTWTASPENLTQQERREEIERLTELIALAEKQDFREIAMGQEPNGHRQADTAKRRLRLRAFEAVEAQPWEPVVQGVIYDLEGYLNGAWEGQEGHHAMLDALRSLIKKEDDDGPVECEE